MPAQTVMREIAAGRAVLPANRARRNARALAVGRAFQVKVNANIGRSADASDNAGELLKLETALAAGADFIMDLSVGEGLGRLRRRMLAKCPAPFGTVPIYEALSLAGNEPAALTAESLLAVIEEQAGQGVDFMTLHAGVRRRDLPFAVKRLAGIVSRGGAILADWMAEHGAENPLYQRWDDVLDICRAHDVTVSLGDALRPGCQADAGDKAQFSELNTLGKLVARCRQAGVQAMVEGPGHVPIDQIPSQMRRQARVCGGAPFYVLGPVVTDIAPGFDHITAAIGAAMAAYHGASLLCYVTPAEHLGLPFPEEIRRGVIAFRIAAHAADIALKKPGARERDDAITRARAAFDWKKTFELALDGETAAARFRLSGRDPRKKDEHCSMCGPGFCAMRNSSRTAEKLARDGLAGRCGRRHGRR